MGLLQNGEWVDKWYDTKSSNGEFQRQDSAFRNWITPTGEAGPTGKPGFKAESGRYHLYVSLACPWAHRTLIFRELKSLSKHIDVTVVDYLMLEHGWTLEDPLYEKSFLYELYLQSKPEYEGRVTVPVLWDKQTEQIVSNESADIIRMMNSAFNELTGNTDDYYPVALRSEIDALNELVYHSINNGVYLSGFATQQAVYQRHVTTLFAALDKLEERLGTQRYLVSDQITEADWRLFTTLIRFDSVYVGHFKCNLRTIESYPNLSAYLRELYQVDGVSQTVDFEHIKGHYYESHLMINPTGIVPAGPTVDYMRPHGRG
jgi:putative glutathione S-transferase